MDTNKTTAIIVSIFIVMICLMFSIMSISNAYIKSPNEFTLIFEIENKTQEVIKDLNGTITINNYYGYLTKEFTLCKDKHITTYLRLDGEIIGEDTFEDVYECNLTKIKNG